MPWRNSRIAGSLNALAEVIAVVGLVMGAFVALEAKGHAWGAPLAILAGGFVGWLAGYLAAFFIRRVLSRTCPVCEGRGRVANTVPETETSSALCPRYTGVGRIV